MSQFYFWDATSTFDEPVLSKRTDTNGDAFIDLDTELPAVIEQTIAMMEDGIRFKRIQLRLRLPDATEAEIDQRLRRWLQRDE